MACHEENPYAKFFGACNDLKLALDQCFKVIRSVSEQSGTKRILVCVLGWLEPTGIVTRWQPHKSVLCSASFRAILDPLLTGVLPLEDVDYVSLASQRPRTIDL